MTAVTSNRAQRIANAHAKVQAFAHDMLEMALLAGRELSAQKAETEHGEWLPWLTANVEFSDRTARLYMQLHEAREQLTEANRQSAADLSLVGALKLIQKPKEHQLSDRELSDLMRGGAPQTVRPQAFEPAPVQEWTGQQTAKFTRALDRLCAATQATEDARGLRGFGAQDQLRQAAVTARQAAAALEDLAASF